MKYPNQNLTLLHKTGKHSYTTTLLISFLFIAAQSWAQITGSTCENPIVIESLPFLTSDNSTLYGDDYDIADLPPRAPEAIGYPGPNYITGNDVVYTYTALEDGAIDILVTNTNAGSGVFVFQGCPFTSMFGGLSMPYQYTDLALDQIPVVAGDTYFIVVSSWAQTINFTLSIMDAVYDCPDLGIDFGTPCDDQNPLTQVDIINEECICLGELGFNCASAIPLDCNTGPITYSTINSNAVAPPTYCSLGSWGLYFSFIGTGFEMKVSASANFSLALLIKEETCDQDDYLDCYSGGTSLTSSFFNTIQGETYYLYIAKSQSGNQRGNITVNLMCSPVPENNDCDNAMPLTCGQNAEVTTAGSTLSNLENPDCTSAAPTNDVFYALDVIAGAEYTITATDSASGGAIIAYSGGCNNLSEVACSEITTYEGIDNTLIFTAAATETLILRTYFYAIYGTDFTISVSCINDGSVFCPDINAYIGHTCDDGADYTEDDIVTEDCICAGTPGCNNNLRIPGMTQNVNTPDTLTLSTCHMYTSYSELAGIIAGYEYQFQISENSSPYNSSYITVRSGAKDGPIVGFGLSPLTHTAADSANLFVHYNADAYCGPILGCATSKAICVTCATILDCEGVPGGKAFVGTTCDDLDPTTYNDFYSDDCACVGTPFDCPALLKNIGDGCNDGTVFNGNGILNEDCECIVGYGFSPANAIPIYCNIDPVTYSSIYSNANEPYTYCSDLFHNNGLYFSFVGTGADIIINCSATFPLGMHFSVLNGYGGGCAAGGSQLGIFAGNTLAGEIYYLYVGGYLGNTTGNITITLDCAPNSENDICQTAIPLACGEVLADNAVNASLSGMPPPDCASGALLEDLFYSLEVLQGVEYTIAAEGNFDGSFFSDFFATLAIYNGECNDLTQLYCSENYTDPQPENAITFTASANETLTIRVYGHYFDGHDYTISVSCNDDGAIFCPDLNAYVGDICNDGNPDTDTDYIDEDCICKGYSSSTCQFYEYYLSDHDPATGISDIYFVDLTEGVATMQYLTTSDTEVHIAFLKDDNLIYAISKHENSYRTYSPMGNFWGPEISLGADYGEITAATFAPNGKLLFASQNQNKIYSLNLLTNVVSTYDTYSPVTGGDIAFTSDGMLYMATRSGNGLYEVWPADVMPDELLASLPAKVTGLAATYEDQLLVSAQGMNTLQLYNTDGTSASTSYSLLLNGQPYTLRDGDLASACIYSWVIDDCENPVTLYVNHGAGINGSDLYSIEFTDAIGDLTYLTNVDFEAHIGFNSQSFLVYFVNKNGSNIRVFDLLSGTFVGDLSILGDIDNITAVNYNPNDGMLYVGDANSDVIATIDLSTGIASFYANAPVYGGDMTLLNGIIYLANRSSNLLYEVWPSGNVITAGTIPHGVNGMTLMPDQPNLITSSATLQAFVELNPDDATTLNTYTPMLNGNTFTIANGDMASGCFIPMQNPTNPIQAEPQSHLSAYPNPTTGQSEVVFHTTATSQTRVEVFDMNGRNIATLFNGEAQQDRQYRLSFDGSYLPNGIYIYRLTTQNETIIEKLIIAH